MGPGPGWHWQAVITCRERASAGAGSDSASICDGAGYNAVISCREREPAPVPAHEVEMPPDITCNIVPVPPIDSIIRGSGK